MLNGKREERLDRESNRNLCAVRISYIIVLIRNPLKVSVRCAAKANESQLALESLMTKVRFASSWRANLALAKLIKATGQLFHTKMASAYRGVKVPCFDN